jgi:MFS family permease
MEESQVKNDQISEKTMRKAVFAGVVGSIIEWYDYALYGAAASLVINKLFFPNLEGTIGILAAFATFAVGYVARPLGGIAISHIGDRFGRKPALIFALTLMGASTLLLGMLPTYYDIGVWATVFLVALRLIQGFGAGAELAGALTFVAEYVPVNRRAFFTSIINASTVVGILCATFAFLLVSKLPEEVFLNWGWRVPFLVSILLFAVAIFIRKQLDETPEYVKSIEQAEAKKKDSNVPLKELLRNSRKEVFFAFLSVAGHQAVSYILSVYSISYMINIAGMSRSESLTALVWASIAGIIGTPLMGMLADKIGAAKVFSFGCIFIACFSYPFFWMLKMNSLVIATLAMCICYGIGYGATSGSQGAFLVNLFPTRYRYSGVALSRELNGMLIAGPTPFVAAALVAKAGGEPTYVAAYLMICCIVSLIAIQVIKRRSIHE